MMSRNRAWYVTALWYVIELHIFAGGCTFLPYRIDTAPGFMAYGPPMIALVSKLLVIVVSGALSFPSYLLPQGITFQVLDADSRQPVSGTEVVQFKSALEPDVPFYIPVKQWSPSKRIRTDERGYACFTETYSDDRYGFGGKECFFIDVSRHWFALRMCQEPFHTTVSLKCENGVYVIPIRKMPPEDQISRPLLFRY